MSKSRDAFRTISEVSDWLDTPAHVLRFWESKFAQVKPVKRAGGRRYYRPQDMALLGGIKRLLHEDGMTIKGVQKLLREKGIKHVAALGPALPWEDDAAEAKPKAKAEKPPAKAEPPAEETVAEAPAAETPPEQVPETEVAITNVVPLGRDKPAPGPAVSVNLGAAPQEATASQGDDADAQEPAAAELADLAKAVPADPADSASKAPARFFHHWREIPDPEARLAHRRDEIAPLLDRMRSLRNSIRLR